ncbi:MAG: FG-GAP-like repeat-containing protein [Polyangiaceae bacterium]
MSRIHSCAALCALLLSAASSVGCDGGETGQGGKGGSGDGGKGGSGGEVIPDKPTTHFEEGPVAWSVPLGGTHLAGFSDFGGEAGNGDDVAFGDQRYRMLDLTGDHKPDLVVPALAVQRDGYSFWNQVPGFKDDKPFWYVYKNNGSGFDAGPIPWFVPKGGAHAAGFNDLSGEAGNGDDVSFGDQRWRLTDIDGDGLSDIVITAVAVPRDGYSYWNQVPGFKDGKPFWYVYKNNGSGFEQGPIPWFVPVGGAHLAGFNDLSGEPGFGDDVAFGDQRWRLMDIDADGKADLVVTATAQPRDGYSYWSEVPGLKDGKPFWYVYKNNGAGFEQGPIPWFVPVGGTQIAGFNDLAGEPSSGNDVVYGEPRWRTSDVDGDGKIDLVVTATSQPRDGYSYWPEVPGYKDGKPFWYVYKNNGGGFEQGPIPWFVPLGGGHLAGFNDLAGEPSYGGEVTYGDLRWRSADMNSDGKADLVVTATAEPRDGYSYWPTVPGFKDDKPFWYVYINNGSGFEQGPIPWFVPKGGTFLGGFNDLSGDPSNGSDMAYGYDRWRTSDLDGDGRMDIVVTGKAAPRDGYNYWVPVNGYGTAPLWYVFHGAP